MTSGEVLDSNKSNTCKKCGKEIMDGDTYCYSCGHKHNAFTLLVIILCYFILAIILLICALSGIEILFAIACVGIISPTLLVPIISSKKMWFRPIRRKIYQSYPFTLKELEKKFRNDEKVISDYKSSNLGKEDQVKNHFFFFEEYVKKNIFRKLPNAKSNLISDYPGYYEFVHGVSQPQAPAPTPASPIPPDIKFPKYTEEQTKDDERDKLLKRISDLYRENEELKKRKPKKAFVAVIVVSLVIVVASIIGMVYMLDQTFVEQYKVKELQKAENIYSEYVVFVTTDNFYHKASCIIIRDSWDSYEAYTRSSVNNSNFQPCPSCFEEKYN